MSDTMKLLTKKEAADYLRVDVRTVDRWRTIGKLKARKAGKGVRFTQRDLDKVVTQER